MKAWIKKKYLVLGIAAFVAVVALYPFESTVVSEWTLEVRDVDGNLCQNMRVTERWAQYSLFLGPNGN